MSYKDKETNCCCYLELRGNMKREIPRSHHGLYASVVVLYVTTDSIVGKQDRWRHVRVALHRTTHTKTRSFIITTTNIVIVVKWYGVCLSICVSVQQGPTAANRLLQRAGLLLWAQRAGDIDRLLQQRHAAGICGQ